MSGKIVTKSWYIGGMTCINCEHKIYRKLNETDGIISVEVSYGNGTVTLSYDEGIISLNQIIKKIEQMDYQVLEHNQSLKDRQNQVHAKKIKDNHYSKGIGVLIILLALYLLIQLVGASGLFNRFPVAEEGMGYGMLFVIGLLTSVHCVAMCGGICLSQCITKEKGQSDQKDTSPWKPSLLYNVGRVTSYTMIGGIVGGLGAVVSFSGTMKGIVQIVAGIFMVIMGMNMLGVFPALRKLMPRLPKSITNIVYENTNRNSPFYVGLVNGFMPCGPLQAMQLYALSTGSPWKGAISMFLFSIGTVPLMFGLGTLSALLSKKFTKKIMTVGAALVVVLGIVMFQNGAVLSGIPIPSFFSQYGSNAKKGVAIVKGGIQEVTTTLGSGSYEAITVKKDIPVRWVIQAEHKNLNGCNDVIIIPQLKKQIVLSEGDNIVEFIPSQSGIIPYSCWMGMIHSSITVSE